MRRLDEQYTRTPFYGVLRMTAYLHNLGHEVNPKRVRRLLRLMGLEAVYQKPRPTQSIGCIPTCCAGWPLSAATKCGAPTSLTSGWRAALSTLVAVIDWHSRYVLGWSLSTTLDADFCIETVGRILEQRRCEIFNTDQGAQFTSPRFIQPLLDKGIQVSRQMAEVGRWTIFLSSGSGER